MTKKKQQQRKNKAKQSHSNHDHPVFVTWTILSDVCELSPPQRVFFKDSSQSRLEVSPKT